MNTLSEQSVMPLKPILPPCVCRNPFCKIPFGYCHCRCGQKTRLAKITNKKRYRVAGMPYRYAHGHDRCKSGQPYSIENRGYKTPCWVWQRHINKSGYGMMRDHSMGGKLRSAHRTYYEQRRGKVPDGMTLDHLCRVRQCVNPEHLEPVTHLVNVLRGVSCTITSDKISEVKRLLSQGTFQIQVARLVGISQAAVSDIKLGKKDHRLNG